MADLAVKARVPHHYNFKFENSKLGLEYLEFRRSKTHEPLRHESQVVREFRSSRKKSENVGKIAATKRDTPTAASVKSTGPLKPRPLGSTRRCSHSAKQVWSPNDESGYGSQNSCRDGLAETDNHPTLEDLSGDR